MKKKKKECLLNELHNPHSCLLNALFKSNNNDILHCIESYVTFLYFFTSKFEIVKEKKNIKKQTTFSFFGKYIPVLEIAFRSCAIKRKIPSFDEKATFLTLTSYQDGPWNPFE